MREDDAGTPMFRSIRHDRSQRKRGAALVPRVAGHMNAASLIVDMGDPQILASWVTVSEAAGEKLAGGAEPVQFQREFGTLIPHIG